MSELCTCAACSYKAALEEAVHVLAEARQAGRFPPRDVTRRALVLLLGTELRARLEDAAVAASQAIGLSLDDLRDVVRSAVLSAAIEGCSRSAGE